MVACINAIVGGVTVALAVRWLLAASVPVAAVTGAVVAAAVAAVLARIGLGLVLTRERPGLPPGMD
jgi:hypothetical protein